MSVHDTNPSPLLKTESKKRFDMGDEKRRNKFKERSKNLERGISAPAFSQRLLCEGGHNDGPLAPMPLTVQEAVTAGHGLGHEFVKRSYRKPTYCHHCTELLWGLKNQGLQCTGELATSSPVLYCSASRWAGGHATPRFDIAPLVQAAGPAAMQHLGCDYISCSASRWAGRPCNT